MKKKYFKLICGIIAGALMIAVLSIPNPSKAQTEVRPAHDFGYGCGLISNTCLIVIAPPIEEQ